MITLKLWNELSQESRSAICRIIGTSGSIENEYHHNFDYNALGGKVKSVLECCNKQKDGSINVTVNIKPKMAAKQTKPQTASSQQRPASLYISAINYSLESAVRTLPYLLKQYGDKKRMYEIRVNGEFDWNHKINGFYLGKNGTLFASIYWQGDDTDGEDAVNINTVMYNGSARIPAEHFDDGYRTREVHSDIRIDKTELYKAIKLLIPILK